MVIAIDIDEVERTLQIPNKQNGRKMVASLDRYINKVFSNVYINNIQLLYIFFRFIFYACAYIYIVH